MKIRFALLCFAIRLWARKLCSWDWVAVVPTSFNAPSCSDFVSYLLANGILKLWCSISDCISGVYVWKNILLSDSIQECASSGNKTIYSIIFLNTLSGDNVTITFVYKCTYWAIIPVNAVIVVVSVSRRNSGVSLPPYCNLYAWRKTWDRISS